ncbi:MAG TPA: aminotransferase [Erysipelotrichaceae bacterium]|nr:pyridoxal phosphate-dependent aminotransferase [Erysipelotrichaceae bacterium]HAO61824.1 aminotransferase [Erysipelotrichaceae bacterium]
MKERFNRQVTNIQFSGIRSFSEEVSKVEGIISMTIGEPEFATEQIIKDAAIEALNRDFTHYPPSVGFLDLRRKIVEFEKEKHGLTYDVSEVVITNGATSGLAAVFMALLNPGDEVIIPEPMYVAYAPMIAYCQAKLVSFDTSSEDYQIDEAKLRACVSEHTKILVLTSPNNPTGCVYTQESIDAIARVAKEYGFFVLSDDVYNQLVYLDHLPTIHDHTELRDQIIIAQSLSKPYAMTGWRIGYLLGETSVIREIAKIHQYLVTGISSISQKAAIAALDTDPSTVREIYRRRKAFAMKRFQEMGLPCVEPQGAFYLFPNISEFKMDSLAFCRKAAYEYKVALVPGVYFGKSGDTNIRISFACKEEELKEGLNRLEKMIRDLRGN